MAAGLSYPPVGLTYVAFEGVALLEIYSRSTEASHLYRSIEAAVSWFPSDAYTFHR